MHRLDDTDNTRKVGYGHWIKAVDFEFNVYIMKVGDAGWYMDGDWGGKAYWPTDHFIAWDLLPQPERPVFVNNYKEWVLTCTAY